ncbi:hypothetical protein SAMN04487949_2040 [Halogranum gelatinilyticum]|uniref:DUF7993 domain-containing protein n=1 Tax=Halogranum gelatinilyticum TaxID=660521 RepID=A0A1G9U5P4_9EURY|nr:hypothetical protein [Halogranum gelatinilyticum]SDM54964.1 hypothetical protein SAMN04487949_2040 [Halogranum gelatinilyticum]
MVQDRLRDGKRVAQLLSSEITGNSGRLGPLSVVDADADVEPTADGALAYAVADDATNERIAEVYVQDDRARVEFLVDVDVAAESGEKQDLRVRPKATQPPRTLVFVEDGAQVKWILPVFEVVLASTAEE